MIANYIFAFLGGVMDVFLVFLSYAIFKDYLANYSFSKRAFGKIIGVIVTALLISFSNALETETSIRLFAEIALAGTFGIYDGISSKKARSH